MNNQVKIDWSSVTPPHDCKLHLKVLEVTHSVNSLHNIVIGRVKQCRICGKKFEEYNPDGLR